LIYLNGYKLSKLMLKPEPAGTEPQPRVGEGSSSVITAWQDDVLVVTLNRPHVANALDSKLLRELLQVFEVAGEERCGAVIVTGAGKNFCAGADVTAYRNDPSSMQLRGAFYPPLLALATLPKPVIAAVNGAAAGGAIGFALAADIRIMGSHARLVPSWIHIGLVPDLGTSWMLPRLIGGARAFEWLTRGEPMTAERAVALGLANECVPDEVLMNRACELARELAKKPRGAMAATKQLLAESWTRSFAQQLEAEAVQQERVSRTQGGGE
jgi:2-(1,2-epoxy-1,2-dihydrophenyl)acetyl-CoA isomerase